LRAMKARRATLACLAIAGALSVSPALAQAKTETATDGPLTAQISYSEGGNLAFTNVRIQIFRNGVLLLDRKPNRICEFCVVWPASGGITQSVRAEQLDSNAEPEAIFDLYTGGAHCCFYSLIYRYDPATNTYTGIRHDWLDAYYRLVDLDADGFPEFLTRDDRFAYKYASFVGSKFPPQIWSYESGVMLDVTREFPALVRRSARNHLNQYRSGKGEIDVRAALAAFAADKCLLGNCKGGFALVRVARRQGFLAERFTEFGPSGGKFVRNLRDFLSRLGYL
jgi:hypothetical protein